MPQMGFEPTFPLFEWTRTVHAWDLAATAKKIKYYLSCHFSEENVSSDTPRQTSCLPLGRLWNCQLSATHIKRSGSSSPQRSIGLHLWLTIVLLYKDGHNRITGPRSMTVPCASANRMKLKGNPSAVLLFSRSISLQTIVILEKI